jgi:hypothetical protein
MEADRLECEARNAIMWAGGPAMPSPGAPQAEHTIGKAINGGFDLLEAKCNRGDRVRSARRMAAAGNAGLEIGGRPLLPALQRWLALQPAYPGADVCRSDLEPQKASRKATSPRLAAPPRMALSHNFFSRPYRLSSECRADLG